MYAQHGHECQQLYLPLAGMSVWWHVVNMTLLEYLKSIGENVPVFAERIGEAETTIRKIAYGQRQPSLPLAAKIIAATDGNVEAADMVLPGSELAA